MGIRLYESKPPGSPFHMERYVRSTGIAKTQNYLPSILPVPNEADGHFSIGRKHHNDRRNDENQNSQKQPCSFTQPHKFAERELCPVLTRFIAVVLFCAQRPLSYRTNHSPFVRIRNKHEPYRSCSWNSSTVGRSAEKMLRAPFYTEFVE